MSLGLIDLQANGLLKEKHNREGKLIEVYPCLPDVECLKLKKFDAGIAAVFGTTFVSKHFQKLNM